MRVLKITAVAVGGVVVASLVGLGIAYGVAGAPEKGRVAPNVELAGEDVSGFTSQQLAPVLTRLEPEYDDANISVTAGDDEQFRTTSNDIGLELDADDTARRVMDVGRDGPIVTRMISWLRSVAHARTAEVAVSWNNDDLAQSVTKLDPGPRTEATEPQLRFADGTMAFGEGKAGEGINADDVAKQLPDAAAKGVPIVVKVSRGELEPHFTADELEDAFNNYKASYQPLPMLSGSKTVPLAFDTLQPWLRADVDDNKLQLTLDLGATDKDLPGLLPDAGVPVVQAHWEVVNNAPQFVNGTAGSGCCRDLASTNLRNALFPPTGAQAAQVDLGLKAIEPTPTTQDPNDVGIKEKVSTFTTNYPAGQPRVTNIHRIADLTKGAVIKPGETFSLNGFVGPRTIEKGFVADHAIENGKFVESVGGGISQYSTTLFNAAFFAGLDWNEYMAHTIYINRYPYGREATISYPAPDQKIHNTTPYAILIWPTYTDTSLTVDLYSTKYVDAQQTGQTEQKVGVCTKVTTERTRRYLDGRTVVDTVGALYQPQEGVVCS